MIKRLRLGLLPIRWLNIGLALAAYLANMLLLQVFCQPVLWAGGVLLVVVGAFLLWPWLARAPRLMQYGALLLQGVGLVVCLYCSWFLGPATHAVSLLLGFLLVPLLAWVPVFFAGQMVRRAWLSALPGVRYAFLVGSLIFLPVVAWGEWQYQQVVAAVRTLPTAAAVSPAALAAVLPRSYLAERLVGIGFRYHLLAEYVYDGWRPPLHDPLVNVLVRWHGHYPIPFRSLNEQVATYRLLFPHRAVKAGCTCALTADGLSYRRWKPGINDWSPPGQVLAAGAR